MTRSAGSTLRPHVEAVERRLLFSAYKLIEFTPFGGANGANPSCQLTRDAAGNLYGTTGNAGANNLGTVFEIAGRSGTITALTSFSTTTGSSPSSLLMDASGNFYGTTAIGGAYTDGTVFEIAHGSSAITTLVSFRSLYNGANPSLDLTMDASGNLYGTTGTGGYYGNGTVFEIAKARPNSITTRASFVDQGSVGEGAKLALDAAGNLYGTTYSGGANDDGTVFEIAAGTNLLTTLATFDGANGQWPLAGGVLRDAAGNLYGTTSKGGANNNGVVFELPNRSSTLTTLAAFDLQAGINPGGLSMDSAGNLYGTMSGGGPSGSLSGRGTVFELPKGSSTVTVLAAFDGTNGSSPDQPGMTLDASGNLYGTTAGGGPGGVGTAFELSPIPTPAVTLTLASGSNPSTPSQSLTFTATVTDGVPDGDTMTLVDTTNNNHTVATGTLSGGSATLAVPAGALAVGTHDLVAVYAGDPNFAASQSTAYVQVVRASPPYLIDNPVINGDDPNGLFTAAGQPNPGVQRSMVEDIVYTFSEPVTIPDANAAFTVVGAGPHAGTAPSTLIATAVPGSNGAQWAVSLTGQADGVLASIANGEYSITIHPASVFAAADGTTAMTTGRIVTFYRLFGDINGDRVVNVSDEFQFSKAMTTYNPIFDVNGDGTVNLADEFQASRSFSSGGYAGDGFVTTI